ncbi:MAG: ABC transporter permease [Bacilli bacterium]|jgi:ABC-2 type transport system permease protein|nr:ABC transporter permease [Bacilli bacterium]
MRDFFKYRFKSMIRSKSLLFWCFAFPIILVTFFHLAFSNIKTQDSIEPFKVGMVTKQKNNNLVSVINEVKINDENLFKLSFYDNKDDGEKELQKKEIAGLIIFNSETDFSLEVNQNSQNQIILQEFLNNYHQKINLITDVAKQNHQLLTDSNWINNNISTQTNHITSLQINDKVNNQLIVSFYSVIAMAALYGAFISTHNIDSIQGNLKGARLSISPFKKSHIIIANMSVCLIINFMAIIVLLLYMKYAINVDLSNQTIPVLIIALIGSIFATSFGHLIGCVFKKETTRLVFVLVFTMTGSFLAGMMAPQINYLIKTTIPILSYLNPVALITDCFYYLYYYNSFSMALPNIAILVVMSILCLVFSIIELRSDSYESL